MDLQLHKASIRIFFDCEFNVNPGYTSMQFLAAIKPNTFRRLVTPLVCSARQKRIHSASSSWACLRTSTTGTTRQTSRIPRGLATSQHASGQCTGVFLGPDSEGKWEYDNWLTENHKGHFHRTGFADSSNLQRMWSPSRSWNIHLRTGQPQIKMR